MTREEAIKAIKSHCYFANLVPVGKEALDMAIKALEQEPCDCISRQAVLDEFYEHFADDDLASIDDYENYTKIVKALPSIQPKTGHWKKTGFIDKVICDVCNKRVWDTFTDGVLNFQYCPNCGAKMLPTDSEKE